MTVETFQGGPPGLVRCRVCGADVPAGPRCPRCSAALGRQDPCPHCRAEAGASPHRELRYACDVCGGPRVPRLDPTIKYSGREVALLRKADAARKGRAGWRAGALASGALAAFLLLMFIALLAILGGSALVALIAVLLMAPVTVFAIMALTRATARGREIAPALDAAWLSVAGDVARQTRGRLTAEGLAQRLGIEEAQAEELIALLDVNEAVSPGMRIETPSLGAPGTTQLAAAEEEAALAEQAAAEARAAARKQ